MVSISAIERVDTTADDKAHGLPGAADLLRARYGADKVALPSAWNDTLATILSHRSVRAYLPTPLPAGTLELIIAAAQSASTSSNLQVWSVVAVEDPARKARLADFAGKQKHIEQAPLFLIFLADLSRIARIAEAQGLHAEGLDYLETFLVGAVDAALAAQNAVIALESLGLGSVYIGGIRNRPEDVAAELGLPPQVAAIFGLCVGYPDQTKFGSVKPRLPQSVVLHRERYTTNVEAEALDAYDDGLRQFQKGQGMGDSTWRQLALDRVKSIDALRGRDQLSNALHKLGFPLR
jgi:nitroreductase